MFFFKLLKSAGKKKKIPFFGDFFSYFGGEKQNNFTYWNMPQNEQNSLFFLFFHLFQEVQQKIFTSWNMREKWKKSLFFYFFFSENHGKSSDKKNTLFFWKFPHNLAVLVGNGEKKILMLLLIRQLLQDKLK